MIFRVVKLVFKEYPLGTTLLFFLMVLIGILEALSIGALVPLIESTASDSGTSLSGVNSFLSHYFLHSD